MFLKFVQYRVRAALSRLNRLHVCYKALLIMMIGTLLYLVTVNLLDKAYRQNLRQCYASKRMYDSDANVRWLDDILHSTRQPRLGRTIFFHQTTCLNVVVELTNRYSFITLRTIDAYNVTGPSLTLLTLTLKTFYTFKS